jgi:hypothetical protein
VTVQDADVELASSGNGSAAGVEGGLFGDARMSTGASMSATRVRVRLTPSSPTQGLLAGALGSSGTTGLGVSEVVLEGAVDDDASHAYSPLVNNAVNAALQIADGCAVHSADTASGLYRLSCQELSETALHGATLDPLKLAAPDAWDLVPNDLPRPRAAPRPL